MSIRSAARALHYDHAYLSRVLSGKQPPSLQLAGALDQLLTLGDKLTKMVLDMAEEEAERVTRAIANPSRVDGQTVKALAGVLAAQRRLDDVMGPAPLITPAEAQMDTVLGLLKETRGPHRAALVEVAAESVQFSGWLHASARNDDRAVRFLQEATELADEAESGTLAAQACNFRGYIARQQGSPRAMVRWFGAAYHTPGAHPAQRMGDAAQVAQGLGELGQTDDARRLLEQALDLEDAAQDQPPGTAYWLTPTFQRLNLGLAHLGLKEYDVAAEHIRSGLQGLPPEQQGAEWTKEHRDALAEAEANR
ncbi:hypothetical protein E0L36_26775 [Streptomyces sp. AJS327]|uniref:hypothetical protein n=1 Tax=Streptomyces sp. AJS327 TaxID=2545265 RepID=UPI0015DF3264|nr:hypothetical protein [Streptomyces sp. AJS327]MBA0054324.1 hypothetical protein [Streptomyces sp. AJS327]